ncbi:MAG: altronate dehydratase large subunit [Thermodesulfobacteriota bacterium]|nr:altronate dehydratase large subunit [Thermodesulfobacteriota bacterium]
MSANVMSASEFRFPAFVRLDGRAGTRNHLAVVSASVCASPLVDRLAREFGEPATALSHNRGCCQIGEDFDRTQRVLTELSCHPNVGAVLLVALGCEGTRYHGIVDSVRSGGRSVELIQIYSAGGSAKALARGHEALSKLVSAMDVDVTHRECGLGDLVLGLECGGSDATSGLAANPVLGWVSDRVIEAGGTVILSETTELIGAEHLLAARTPDPANRKRLLSMVKRIETLSSIAGVDIRGSQPTPGNIEGGISTIEEKSLGNVYKAGRGTFSEILDFGCRARKKGLVFMDTPGQDVESMTGMAAAGAQVILFSTGRGTPMGFPIVPVVKITGNADTYRAMTDDIDINAGTIIESGESIASVGERVLGRILEVCRGTRTCSEVTGYSGMSIPSEHITL